MLYRYPINSHKGQNGKLLVIGGSKLFHSSIFWSADAASKIVDLVHLTSPANENNQIFRKRLKEKFWNGIVVDWADIESYINEDDCVLIGPGMTRTDETALIVDFLLKKYPTKKWVIDGGALQMVDPELITESCILTPHRKEFLNLINRMKWEVGNEKLDIEVRNGKIILLPTSLSSLALLTSHFAQVLNCIILLKGPTDTVCQGSRCVEIPGGPPSLATRLWELFVHGSWRAIRRAGNPGMTKGGTGDVLAGLVAALYCKNDSWVAATVGSWVNKQAGDELFKRVGTYFNAADLVAETPKILRKLGRRV